MKKTSVFLLNAAALVFVFCLAGCATTGSDAGASAPPPVKAATIAGTWVPAEGLPQYDNFIEEKLELSEDGTGVFEGYAEITWTAENNRLILSLTDLTLEYNYVLSGSTLTLTRDNGNSVKYKKQ